MNWNKLQASHEDLSAADWAFRQFASQDPDCLRRSAFDRPHPLRSLVSYDLQPWPVFVGRQKLRELTKTGQDLSRLVRSLPQRVFNNDPERISGFYGLEGSDFVADILAPPNGIAEAISRGDFAAHESGLKCLEFNCAGNLGGWESEIMADYLLQIPMIVRFIQQHDLSVSVTNSLRVLLSCALRQADAAGLRDDHELNMALVATADSYLLQHPKASEVFEHEYRTARREALPSTTGNFFLSDGSDGELLQDRLFIRGHRIHSVIEAEQTAAQDLLFRAFKRRQLQVYNGAITLLLNDKRNLALLSELGKNKIFGAAEQTMIRNHIPWTRCIKPGSSRYRGETVNLPDFLVSLQHRMVLKKGQSRSGEDVLLGKNTTPEQWAQAVREALASGDWVAQEFVESRPYLFQAGDEGSAPHDLIWGVFIFGDTYAGTTVRVLPKAADSIVSASRGATKSLLLELIEESDPV